MLKPDEGIRDRGENFAKSLKITVWLDKDLWVNLGETELLDVQSALMHCSNDGHDLSTMISTDEVFLAQKLWYFVEGFLLTAMKPTGVVGRSIEADRSEIRKMGDSLLYDRGILSDELDVLLLLD